MKHSGMARLLVRLVATSKKAISIYGWEAQYDQAIEEKAELIVELLHAKRKDKENNIKKIQLEVVQCLIMDVQVCISAFPSLYGFMRVLLKQIQRLNKRLFDEKDRKQWIDSVHGGEV